jgi:hypothetical protein
MIQDLKCTKCQNEMVQRFIPDYAHATKTIAACIESRAKRSWWQGIKVSVGGGIPIVAFPCSGCGLLEFYADEKFAA